MRREDFSFPLICLFISRSPTGLLPVTGEVKIQIKYDRTQMYTKSITRAHTHTYTHELSWAHTPTRALNINMSKLYRGTHILNYSSLKPHSMICPDVDIAVVFEEPVAGAWGATKDAVLHSVCPAKRDMKNLDFPERSFWHCDRYVF